MKGILKVLLLGVVSVGMLSGCGDASPKLENSARAKMNTTERSLFDTYEDYLKTYKLRGVLESVRKRSVKPKDTDVPFCDVVEPLSLVESQLNINSNYRKFLITEQWKAYKGETLRESCAKANGEVKALVTEVVETVEERYTPVEEEIREQVLDDTISLKRETLLSPEKIRELTNSVGECNTAKVQLIVTMNRGEPLTVNDYEKVSELILGCEMDLLREELNK